VHEVATDSHDICGMQQRARNWSSDDGKPARVAYACALHHREDDHSDHDEQRQPEPIRRAVVRHIAPPLRPVRERAFLRERGIRYQSRVVPHAKKFTGDR
jgi:hypothetical protein